MSQAVWAGLGTLLGLVVAVAIELLKRKPTPLELEGDAFEQLQSLSNLYRADLIEARTQRAEALKVEQALWADLGKAHGEIRELREELRLARLEILELREAVRRATGNNL